MLNQLVLNNFPTNHGLELSGETPVFTLKTCQRTLVLSYGANPMFTNSITQYNIHEYYRGAEAYNYLLEIICGLKSKLVGENEIVSQFKLAFKEYLEVDNRCNKLLLILEKLFKDAKEIRSKYLLGLCQKTYASIARKQMIQVRGAKEILVLGSGALAEDLINQYKKKAKVFISARNSEKAQKLAHEHGIEVIPWNNVETYKMFAFIANTIGFDGVLLNNSFFTDWSIKHSNKLFIDLGSPSAIETSLDFESGVMRLDDIFKEGAVHENHKKQQIEKAKIALENVVAKRHEVFMERKLKEQLHAS